MSIIVVSWNTRELTLRCLDSVTSSLGGTPADIVVVDNASTDGSADAVAARHPGAVLVRSEVNLGFAAGVNLGLGQVRDGFVVLVNPDAVVRPGAVQHLVDQLVRHPDMAVVGGRQVDRQGRFVPTGHHFPWIGHDLVTAPGVHRLGRVLLRRGGAAAGLFFATAPRDVDWLSGAFVAFRRSIVDQVGPLPEEFFVYGEDIEWCWRIRRHGGRIRYCDGPGIIHDGGRSAEHLAGDAAALRILDALHVFARRHRHPVAWRAGWLARLVFLRLRLWLRLRPWSQPRGGAAQDDPDSTTLRACADRTLEHLMGRHAHPAKLTREPGRRIPAARR